MSQSYTEDGVTYYWREGKYGGGHWKEWDEPEYIEPTSEFDWVKKLTNPKSLAGVVYHNSKNNNPDPLIFAANNQHTWPGTLSKIADDPRTAVAIAVLYNPNTPTSALKKLAKHPDALIRNSLVSHKKVTPEILKILAYSTEPFIIEKIIKHPLASENTKITAALNRK